MILRRQVFGERGSGTPAPDSRVLRVRIHFVRLRRFLDAQYLLARPYRGQIHERTGRARQAVGEYRYFLSSFDRSNAKFPQIAEAREPVRRLA